MSDAHATESPRALPAAFLRATRSGEDTGAVREALATLSPDDLDASLPDDASRLAFWLNCYNAVTQFALQRDPDAYDDRGAFFARERVTVAGHDLSLDDIEHGLLRRSQWKYGLGYVPNPFADAFEKRFRVDELDPRIHFAMNCGAASCPPIARYEPPEIDAQLERATVDYLEAECVREGNTLRVPRLLLWFRGDFGGGSGIRSVLREYGVIAPDESPRIRYRAYDWSLALENWRSD